MTNLSHDEYIQFLELYLKQINPRSIVSEVITVAHKVGYYKQSDGITLMHELNFRGIKMPHPIGVGHDLLYDLGVTNVWLPDKCRTDFRAQRFADLWFRDAMLDFGHWARGRVWTAGLRLGGFYGWSCHRRKRNPQPDLYREVLVAWCDYHNKELPICPT